MDMARRIGIILVGFGALVAVCPAEARLPATLPDDLCKSLPSSPTVPTTLVTSQNIDLKSGVKLPDLYARIQLETRICGEIQPSKDKSRLKQMAAKLGFNSAKTVSTLVRIGNLPPLQVISYEIKTGERKSSIVARKYFPWYPAGQTNEVTVENRSTTATTMGALSLLSYVGGLIPPETMLLSPATAESLKATTVIAQNILDVFGRDNNGNALQQPFDPNSGDGGMIVYLLDRAGQPLTVVSVKLVFTASLAQPTVIEGTGDVTPHFGSLPQILSKVTIDASGRKLRDALGTDGAAMGIARADAATPPAEYAAQCKALKTRLSNGFGLNRFDTLLALAEWLSENSYVSVTSLHESGCLQPADKALLTTMGLANALDMVVTAPKTVTLEDFCGAIRAAFSNGDLASYGDAFRSSVLTIQSGSFTNYNPTNLLTYMRGLAGTAGTCRLEGVGDTTYYVLGFTTSAGRYEIAAKGTNTGPGAFNPVRNGVGQVEIKQVAPPPPVAP